MSLGLQLGVLCSDPKYLAAGAITLAILVQALYEKRKRTKSEGRAPMVSYLIPWVGSALDIGRDPDDFFDRAQ